MSGAPRARIGIVGGSGLYELAGLEGFEEVRLETPFGAPSDAYLVGRIEGRGVAFLAQLSRNCGVPQTLSEIKIPRDAIPSLAQAAMQVTRLLKNNLRPVTEPDAVAIYEAAF